MPVTTRGSLHLPEFASRLPHEFRCSSSAVRTLSVHFSSIVLEFCASSFQFFLSDSTPFPIRRGFTNGCAPSSFLLLIASWHYYPETFCNLYKHSFVLVYKPNNMSGRGEDLSFHNNGTMKLESHRGRCNKDAIPGSQLWTDGLICAFEFIRGRKKSVSKGQPSYQINDVSVKNQTPSDGGSMPAPQKESGYNLLKSSPFMKSDNHSAGSLNMDSQNSQLECFHSTEKRAGNHWSPIGWSRISELVQTVKVDADWSTQEFDTMDDEDDLTVADLVAPYWESPAGPRWWCHLAAGHPYVDAWLNNAHWLHPAISTALRDESKLISERMKHLLYEVPVRVAGGLLFEILGQSAGDPCVEEDDIPVVVRSWQAQKFLLTVLHVKGSASRINVLGVVEVQELLLGGGYSAPRTVHEIIAQLVCRLARWDDRLFRKSIFGAADEMELKFMNRRNHEDLNLFGIILNQEIRRLSRQVIRVKWSLHAREEIVFELLQHLRGNLAKILLDGTRKSTREMIEEQEAVRGRLFTIQDVMQSTVRAWLQDKSLTVTHNLAVFGGCGLVLSIITGLFGINVDGIPGAEKTPYAFALFSALLFFIGIVLIAVGLIYLGLKKPVKDDQVKVMKMELDELVKMFQHEAETHAQVHKPVSRHNLPPTAGDRFSDDADYVLIS